MRQIFKSIALLSLCLLLFIPVDLFAQQPGDSTWLMFRHDVYHTGLSPLKGNMVACELSWSYTTGDWVESSPALGDIDGDSLLEVVFGSYDNKVYALNGFVGIEESETITQKGFSLIQNQPNPFNKYTVISYELPHKSRVLIRIYDLTGKLVKTLVQGDKEAGYYTVRWDTETFGSGIYFIEFEAGNYREIRKIVLVR